VVSTTPRPLYPGKDSVTIVQDAGWATGPFWTCAKNLSPTGIRSPERPARSQSLYRLNYPALVHTMFRGQNWLLSAIKYIYIYIYIYIDEDQRQAQRSRYL
jgi:hypothetical protein